MATNHVVRLARQGAFFTRGQNLYITVPVNYQKSNLLSINEVLRSLNALFIYSKPHMKMVLLSKVVLIA